jgi:hypothetical protein
MRYDGALLIGGGAEYVGPPMPIDEFCDPLPDVIDEFMDEFIDGLDMGAESCGSWPLIGEPGGGLLSDPFCSDAMELPELVA